MQQLAFGILNIITDLLGILLNGKVILSFSRQSRDSSFIGKWFLLNLMISNLVLCTGSLILTVLMLVKLQNEFLQYNLSFILVASVGAEACLLLVTADRFIAVQFPLLYPRLMKNNVAISCIALNWLLLVTTAILIGLTSSNSTGRILLESIIKGMWISMVVVTLAGVLILSFVNLVIFHEIKKQTNRLLSLSVNNTTANSVENSPSTQLLRDQQKRSAILCFGMVICFILCWLPTVVFSCIALINDQSTIIDDFVWYISRLFISASMIINPCFYGLIKKGKCTCM